MPTSCKTSSSDGNVLVSDAWALLFAQGSFRTIGAVSPFNVVGAVWLMVVPRKGE